MTFEKIDEASDTSKSDDLITLILNYLNDKDLPLKDRLLIERKIKKYQDSNSADWLLNLIINIHKQWLLKTKENK